MSKKTIFDKFRDIEQRIREVEANPEIASTPDFTLYAPNGTAQRPSFVGEQHVVDAEAQPLLPRRDGHTERDLRDNSSRLGCRIMSRLVSLVRHTFDRAKSKALSIFYYLSPLPALMFSFGAILCAAPFWIFTIFVTCYVANR